MSPWPSAFSLLAAFAFAACGQSESSSGGGGQAGASDSEGGGGSGASSGGNSFVPEPGCRSNADCSADASATCFRFGDDGPGACGRAVVPVTGCETENTANDCCSSADCASARCFAMLEQPVPCSSTAGFDVVNRCVADTCSSDAECSLGLCSPDGLRAGRSCIEAACASDLDCSAESGGVCAYLDLGCCRSQVGGASSRPATIACVYPGSGCQSDADCGDAAYCVLRGGRAECSATCP